MGQREFSAALAPPIDRRKSALNARGLPCGAWAMHGEDTCYRHSMSDEEWLALGQKGGKTNAKRHAQRRAQKELMKRGSSVPRDEHAEALRRLSAAEARLHELYEQGRISAAELPRILHPGR